jgi:hypothetical protein
MPYDGSSVQDGDPHFISAIPSFADFRVKTEVIIFFHKAFVVADGVVA